MNTKETNQKLVAFHKIYQKLFASQRSVAMIQYITYFKKSSNDHIKCFIIVNTNSSTINYCTFQTQVNLYHNKIFFLHLIYRNTYNTSFIKLFSDSMVFFLQTHYIID